MNEKKSYRVLYVHGFGGHENGSSSKILKNELSLRGYHFVEVDAPAIPYMEPRKAIEFIESKKKDYDAIIASSLGSFYSLQVDGIRKVLINPAIPSDLLKLKKVKLSEEYMNELYAIEKEWLDRPVTDYEENMFVFGHADKIAQNRKLLEEKYKTKGEIALMAHELSSYGVLEAIHLLEKYMPEKPHMRVMDYDEPIHWYEVIDDSEEEDKNEKNK